MLSPGWLQHHAYIDDSAARPNQEVENEGCCFTRRTKDAVVGIWEQGKERKGKGRLDSVK